MAKSASEVRSMLPCPLCGRSLIPVPTGSSVTFHCKSGHELALVDLLTAQSVALKGGLEALLGDWRRQHQALIAIIEDARKNGFIDVAEIFHRHAENIESRITVMRNAFSQADSSKLIKVPNSIKPT